MIFANNNALMPSLTTSSIKQAPSAVNYSQVGMEMDHCEK